MVSKEKIFRELYANLVKRDEYFDTIPRDINMAFVQNEYVDNLLHERDMLIRLIFGDQSEAIEWFLYEWRPGFEVGCLGVCVPINNIDDYIDYMKKYEGFE